MSTIATYLDKRSGQQKRAKVNAVISLIVPTRNRPENILRFSQSLRTNTADPDRVELVLVIDDDDRSYDGMSYEGLWVTRVTTPRGSTMGELNRAGYNACSGDYIMLLNDDVIIETPKWDKLILGIFHAHPDDIILVHVNDKLFYDKLCTFPFVTRLFCELADGICPADYRRYRIDDHIYNVFNLVSMLGHNRIVYLPDVEFRHLNFVTNDFGHIEYQPDPEIHQADTNSFDAALPDRKALALKLVDVIDQYRRQQVQEVRSLVLEPIVDSVSLRRPEFIRTVSLSSRLNSDRERVTVGVVSADIRSKHAQACLQAIKAYTHNYDLVVLDNNRGPNFNHPREMNAILSVCRNNYLVLMDDDVVVEPGWLNGLLSGMGPQVGVVTPLHKSTDGQLSYAGVVMRPDHSGHHTHAFALYPRAFPIQTLCSAIVLIDMNKCGQLRLDESYSKYFLDLDYGLRVWESGFEVVCSPDVAVTHIGGATLDWASEKSSQLFEEQRQHFVKSWIDTGRYQAIEGGPQWQNAAEIDAILSIPGKLSLLLQQIPEPDPDRALAEAHEFFDRLNHFPAVKHWVCNKLWAELPDRKPDFSRPEDRKYAALLGQLEYPVFVDDVNDEFAVFLWSQRYYAVPKASGHFEGAKALDGLYRSEARRNLLMTCMHGSQDSEPTREIEVLQPVLLEEGYKGFNLVRFDCIYGLAQGDGAFDAERAAQGGYSLRGETLEIVKDQIDAIQPIPAEEGPAQRDGAFDTKRAAQDGYSFNGETVETVKDQTGAMQPVLVVEGYKGFNLVQFDCVYGLAQRDGAFDPVRAAQGGYPLRGETIESVKAQINKISNRLRSVFAQRWSSAATKNEPKSHQEPREQSSDSRRWVALDPARQVVDDYKDFSIHRFEYKFFAIPRSKGAFFYDAHRRHNSRLIGHSIEEVKKIIDRQSVSSSPALTRLIFASLAADKMERLLPTTDYATKDWLLVGREQDVGVKDLRRIVVEYPTVMEWSADVAAGKCADPTMFANHRRFDTVLIPWSYPETWQNNSLELSASLIASHIEVVTETGQKRSYHGETIHRLLYNKAYLSSMLEVIPLRGSLNVLEVGCSDGLVCDILSLLGAGNVTGVDVMTTVGCSFQGTNGVFLTMDATELQFDDESFDLIYSIATLEHVPNPYKAIDEMIRTLRVGGYCYVQAAPLYYSPFGHHMFSYFADYPWAHLRLTNEEIVTYLKQNGMDEDLLRNFGVTPETYVLEMLNRDHLNGLTLDKYRLHELRQRADIEILKFEPSFEGESLLSSSIFDEIMKRNPDIAERYLVEHGFEIAFRRKS